MATARAQGEASGTERDKAPDPNHPAKPDSPSDLKKPSWKFALKRSFREFINDQCTDLAAALTFYAVLSLFPGIIALVSLLNLVGQGDRTTQMLTDIVRDLAPGDAADTLLPVVEGLTQTQGAGLGLVFGLLTALWTASGYIGAFGRAMNRIYEIEEGRPFWKLRPLQIAITLFAVVLIAFVAAALVLSGPLAEAIGSAIGLESGVITAWQIAKWPVLVAMVVVIIAVLYYATPNIKQPKFTWMSMGAGIALLVWVIASVLFGLYVSNFGNYNATYGTLAGVIVFLLWLWITNLALLFGAEFDSEMERSRELQAGMKAEDELQLPARDTRGIEKREAKEEEARQQAREIRLDADTDRVQSGRHRDT